MYADFAEYSHSKLTRTSERIKDGTTAAFAMYSDETDCLTGSVPIRRNPIRRNANPNPNPKPQP